MASRFSLGNLRRGLTPKPVIAAFVPMAKEDTTYRGHDLEMKSLMVGWQVTVSKKGAVVWHTGIAGTKETAHIDACAYIDRLLLPAVTLPAT